jgi:hypothetical protein
MQTWPWATPDDCVQTQTDLQFIHFLTAKELRSFFLVNSVQWVGGEFEPTVTLNILRRTTPPPLNTPYIDTPKV